MIRPQRKASVYAGLICLPCCLIFLVGSIAEATFDQNGMQSSGNKVIYGADDRIDVYEETDADRRAWADSVCALVRIEDLHDNDDGTWSLHTKAYTVAGKPPCPGEAFSTQPTASFCSGFMAAADIIVTAGHCLTKDTLGSLAFVFGFEMLDADQPRLVFDHTRIYYGVNMIAIRLAPTLDFAVVLVDIDITAPGAQPLAMRQGGEITVGTPVGIIGHPYGLPKKLAFGLNTSVRNTDEPFFFYANVDAFSGNSGSPVFDAETGIVEGILVRGNNDYKVGSYCFQSHRMDDDTATPEAINRSITFVSFVNDYHLPPVNDHCEEAIVIHAEEYYLGSTRSGSTTLMSSCGQDDFIDVWFLFIPDQKDDYLISLCESDFDAILALYTGTCESLEEIACSDSGCDDGASLCISLDARVPIFIRVAGNHGTRGSYLLQISSDVACSSPSCGMQEGFNMAGILLMSMMIMILFAFSAIKSVI